MKNLNPSPSQKLAETHLGGKARIIDINASIGETTWALVSETTGYPVNWKISKTFITK